MKESLDPLVKSSDAGGIEFNTIAQHDEKLKVIDGKKLVLKVPPCSIARVRFSVPCPEVGQARP